MTRGQVWASIYRLLLWHSDPSLISYHIILHTYTHSPLCETITRYHGSAVKHECTCLYTIYDHAVIGFVLFTRMVQCACYCQITDWTDINKQPEWHLYHPLSSMPSMRAARGQSHLASKYSSMENLQSPQPCNPYPHVMSVCTSGRWKWLQEWSDGEEITANREGRLHYSLGDGLPNDPSQHETTLDSEIVAMRMMLDAHGMNQLHRVNQNE